LSGRNEWLVREERSALEHIGVITALAAAVLLVTFSDPLLIVIFVAPAGAALVANLLLALRKPMPWKWLLLLLVALSGAAYGGMALEEPVKELGLQLFWPFKNVIKPFDTWHKEAWEAAVFIMNTLRVKFYEWPTLAEGVARTAGFLVIACSSLWGVVLVFRHRKSPAVFPMLFMFFAGLVLFSAFAIREPKRTYYLSSIFVMSAFFIAVSADDLLSRSSRVLKAVFISLALVFAAYSVYDNLSSRGRQYGYEVAGFLEREGLRFGYSSKLHSHIYTFLSKHRIEVLPVHFMRNVIEPWLWETNLFYYTPDYWRGESFLMIPFNETRENFAMDTPWANTRGGLRRTGISLTPESQECSARRPVRSGLRT
jgi:hypothetical protein